MRFILTAYLTGRPRPFRKTEPGMAPKRAERRDKCPLQDGIEHHLLLPQGQKNRRFFNVEKSRKPKFTAFFTL